VLAVRRREAEIMRRYVRGESCLMELLQRSLDDPTAEPCGRCSVCRGALPSGLSPAPAPETVARVTALLRAEVHVLEPRKMWPGGAFGSRGRIAGDELPAEGRVLAFADAPEWGATLGRAFAGDGGAVAELAQAAVGVLGAWRSSWPARPEVVVDLAASGAPAVAGGVADHLASVGRLGRATVAARPPADARELSSAEEASWWRDHLTMPEAEAVEGRVVLLVVDATSSLWPVSVASALLRRGGARLVLPLVVHRRP